LLQSLGMGVILRLACLAVLISVARQPRAAVAAPRPLEVRHGDVVFQTSTSSRSVLIRQVTQSPYSHVGLVEVAKDGVFVIEAVQPVSRTPLEVWRKRGDGARVTVLRAKRLDADSLRKVVSAAKKELGKPYDARYRWDDEKLYCSELVAKAFERGAGVEVGERQLVKSLQLAPEVIALGPKLGIDLEQTLLTPASIATDPQFEVVHSDFE
jgi:uncharacterized protein YycO